MSEALEKLFTTTDVKQFVALFKEVRTKYSDPQAFLAEVAEYLPVRLYEHHYEDGAPHSFFGLISAPYAQSLVPGDEGWKSLAQQAWFVTKERKRHVWNLDEIPSRTEGSLETRWNQFEAAAQTGNFEEVYSWVKGFLRSEQDRSFFRERSLSHVMDDTAQGGFKLVYLMQAWRFAELLGWRYTDRILFPVFHFIVTGPKDRSLARVVKDRWRTNPLPSLLENEGQLSDEIYRKFERGVLFSATLQDALNALERLAQAGAGLEAARDALLLAAAQAVSNAKLARWIWPVRAFHVGYLMKGWMDLVGPHRKTYGLILATALLHEASAYSRESNTNPVLDEVAQRLCPTDTFNVLRSVVSHSDPYASATAVYAILGMSDEKKEELFRTLIQLALKNDGHICYGNDLLYTCEAIDSYKRSTLAQKDKYIVSVGFFLGRIQKKYELFGELGV